MVSALDSGSGGPGSTALCSTTLCSTTLCVVFNCVVFLGKILYSHSASLHPGV